MQQKLNFITHDYPSGHFLLSLSKQLTLDQPSRNPQGSDPTPAEQRTNSFNQNRLTV